MKYGFFALPALLLACSDSTSSAPPQGAVLQSSSSSGSGASSNSSGGASSTSSSGAPAGEVDGGDPLLAYRPYATTVPASYDAAKPMPLVVLLHGYTSSAKAQDTYFGISALAKTRGFLVALPDGTKDAAGNPFWNATDACCDLAGAKVDDVAYLTAVLADMKRRFNVDPKRVYFIGHSNGAFMSHRMACELSGQIAGIVSLAGAQFDDATKCNAKEPVAVLQVHGDKDETVLYAGGKLFPAAPTYPSAKKTVATWAAKNGCEAALVPAAAVFDLDEKLAGAETNVARHTCTKGAAELWTIVGGPHIPTFQPTWAASIYDFLEAHPKP